jgi:hypothetical protein
LIVRVRKIAFVGLKYRLLLRLASDPAGFESSFATWSALLPPVEGWPGSSLAAAKPDGAAMTTANIDAATRIVMLIICVFPELCLPFRLFVRERPLTLALKVSFQGSLLGCGFFP